jgi:hypothetical protein
MSYFITYKGNKDQLLTFDNTITNDIHRAITFGSEEDAEEWINYAQLFNQSHRALDNLIVVPIIKIH